MENVEMYGFPLTIYLLSGWLSSRYPGLDLFSHDSGHLLYTLLGLKGNPHFDLFHILSNLFIFGGFILLMKQEVPDLQLARAGRFTITYKVLPRVTRTFTFSPI